MNFPETYFDDEVREGFYVPGLMKRCWASGLQLLEELDRICRRHGLRWTIAYGTLLGAVRHRGFIPWDDDIDIFLLREDYEKLREVIGQELPAELAFVEGEKDTEHFGQVSAIGMSTHPILKGRLCLQKYHDFPFAAGMDIFVLDILAENEEEEQLRGAELGLLYSLQLETCKKDTESEAFKETLKRAEAALEMRFSPDRDLKEQIIEEQVKRNLRFQDSGSPYCSYMGIYIFDGRPIERYQRSWFENPVYLPFENTELPAPSGYLEMLELNYGSDYMTPQRGTASHNYPFYQEHMKKLEKSFDKTWLFRYRFSPDALLHEKLPPLRELCFGAFAQLRSLVQGITGEMVQAEPALGDCNAALQDCQSLAIQIGELVEKRYGAESRSVRALESCCEQLYQLYARINGAEEGDIAASLRQLEAGLDSAEECLREELRKLVVLLPSRAAHWESLRKLYRELKEDREYDVRVIPIPYCFRDGYGALGAFRCERDAFPEDVECTDYRLFDFGAARPDCIVLNTPYDGCSFTTSVDPFFYAKNMKRFTNCLVYIPWFRTDEVSPEDPTAVEQMRHYVTAPGVVESDYTLVQSEEMRETYVKLLEEFSGEKKADWYAKILTEETGLRTLLSEDRP